MNPSLFPFIDKVTLQLKIQELGKLIQQDLGSEPLQVLVVLKGAVIFATDLVRELSMPVVIDFVKASSYKGVESTGIVSLGELPNTHLKTVLIIEDIIDTGLTVSKLKEALQAKGVQNIKVCTLFWKPAKAVCGPIVDYCGFEIQDEFVVGFGMDYNQNYRNLPYIATLKL